MAASTVEAHCPVSQWIKQQEIIEDVTVLRRHITHLALPKADVSSIEFQISLDFIRHRVESKGFHWPKDLECLPTDADANKDARKIMRFLGDKFSCRYSETFKSMVDTLRINPRETYSSFLSVANELFKDGDAINWGRIIALYAFGAALSQEVLRRRIPYLVRDIIDWVASYLQKKRLRSWINDNGGWDGFVRKFGGVLGTGATGEEEHTSWLEQGLNSAGGILRGLLRHRI